MKKLLSLLTFLYLIAFSNASFANDNPLLSADFWKTATPETVQQMIDKGNNVNDKDKDSSPPLMLASSNNTNPEVITTLLQNGANINDRDKNGLTSLMLASFHNTNPEIITTLLQNGADVKAKDIVGRTALDYAKENPKIYKTDAYWQMNNLMYE